MIAEYRIGDLQSSTPVDSIPAILQAWKEYQERVVAYPGVTSEYDGFILSGCLVLQPHKEKK